MIGYVVWAADRITPLTGSQARYPGGGEHWKRRPRAGRRLRGPRRHTHTTGGQVIAGTQTIADTGPAPGTTAAPAHRAGPGPFLAPRCLACCRIAMGVTMGYMLITML